MRNAEELLTTISNISKNKPDYVFEGLYRNLFNSDLFLRSYLRLAPNEGNMSKGTDGRTIDGFSLRFVDGIIEELRAERYHPSPARRTYIEKSNGKLRPLGIQTFKDKLVQECVRALLEAIYEPIFSECSHGFRPNRGCHSALNYIQSRGKNASWVVDCDISAFFDNIDHNLLLEIIGKKVKDGRLLELIRRFLKAGFMEDNSFNESTLGSPQGSTLSPLLANIYLNELDRFVEGMCEEWDEGTYRHLNPEYTKLKYHREKALQSKRFRDASALFREMMEVPALDPMDPRFRRVRYCRYADDTVFFVIGPKRLAEEVLEKVKDFLQSNLKLSLNDEKTRIINLSDENVRFLGYEIAKIRDNTRRSKRCDGRIYRCSNGNLTLLVPRDAIQKRILSFSENGKPAVRKELVNMNVWETIVRFNAEINGLYNYYRLAANVSKRLWWFRTEQRYSLLATIARKERSSIKYVLRKYSITVPKNDGHGTFSTIGIVKKDGSQILYRYEGFHKEKFYLAKNPPKDRISEELRDRILRSTCEVCGSVTDVEVHHVRNLSANMRVYVNRTIPDWLKLMWRMRRRTLVLCHSCHNKLHYGKLRIGDELLESPLR
ncbi:group II intron reverse transcriptase/maturase [Methanomethylophilus alvi]|uniref:group II intron reverse transcriptase/maturase n=1 Tax=Methanomethylophilus alvi TaxID=1291540 RepID=UPI0037DC19C7